MQFEINQRYRMHGIDRRYQMPIECVVEAWDDKTGKLTVITDEGKRLNVDTNDERVYATGASLMTPGEMARRGLL